MHTVRFLEVSDTQQVLRYHRRNHDFHRDWSPIPPPAFFTVDFHRAQLERTVELREREEEFRFGIFAQEDSEELLVGRINLVAIERNAFQNGRLGYSIDARHRHRGLMTRMLKSVIGFAFDYARLHRVEANIMPRNIASKRVLEKCGFTKIGFSPQMLFINGKWEDHDMYMLLVDNFRYQRQIGMDADLQAFVPLIGR